MFLTGWDILIVAIPVIFVYYMAYHTRRYARGVSDFLSAGRLCGRYAIAVGDVANAVSIITLASYIEVHYRTGFALSFWQNLNFPIAVVLGLTGFCHYRFRETKAMSLGQFLEMRYSRKFRIFAAALRSLSEIIANSIMPAIAARFFIYYLDLPRTIDVFGVRVSTFMLIMIVCLFIAISIICMGGALSMIVTDCIQGMIMYPIFGVFVIFILTKFDWNNEIVPVMMDRAPQESFLNPFDIDNLRDFNLFFLLVTLFATGFHRASWIGASTSSAARSPHEQKMAWLLGTFRGALGVMLFLLISVIIITVMNHQNFADLAGRIRSRLCAKASSEVVESPAVRKKIAENLSRVPPQVHVIGKDKPLSEEDNLDSRYLEVVHQTLLNSPAEGAGDKIEQTAAANKTFQQYRTLYRQQMLAFAMREVLPPGLTGLFLLLMILAMISTDDTRIYSASLTVAQDVFMPFFRRTLSPHQHIRLIRATTIGVGVIFFFSSLYMAQLDYINLFVNIVCSMWMGGCGPVMIFGLYSRFGTTAGAWTSLLTGMGLSVGAITIQRNWADVVYPFLQRHDLVDTAGRFLETVSRPFHPYIVWKMNAVKCPINSYEFYFMTMMITLALYVIVSYATCKKPFNLERMLHRGKYNLDGENKTREPWTLRNVFSKLIGITPEYTLGDRITAWVYFFYLFIYHFVIIFIAVLIWNKISPWPMEWWGGYFLVVQLIVPGIVAFIVTFWLGIGSIRDMLRLFRDLKLRKANPLDNGQVEGHVSLADKAELEAADRQPEKKSSLS
ncbi:MAG: sodium:panthothenate symporter [Lentisphaeria bacterium]|nr:sodium:panthothenate symporter [Lentisphaeria bacterium]